MRECSKYFIIFILISLMVSFEGLYTLNQNESFDNFVLASIYSTSIIFLEVTFLFIVSFISKNIFFIFFSLFVSTNTLLTKLLFFSAFQTLSWASSIIIVLALSIICTIILKALDRKEKLSARNLILGLLFILVLSPIFTAIFMIDSKESLKHGSESNPSIRDWGNIKLKNKPNIHILGFDSLIPSLVTEKYLDIEKTPYEDIINKHMLKQPLSFTPRVPSIPSLNSAMNLDQANITLKNGYFTGEHPSILSTLASNNGYEITTGYMGEYFGLKGPYVHNYVMGFKRLRNSTLCIESEYGMLKFRLFGICSVLGEIASFKHLVGNEDESSSEWPQQVFRTITHLAQKENPQLSFHYIYNPVGHSPLDYRHSNKNQRLEYQKYFLWNASKVPKLLTELLRTIDSNDSNSLVMIFGDHGAWLSRGVSIEKETEFFLTDRHMIELAVLKTRNSCASTSAFHYSSSYSTPSRVIASFFRCLASDPGGMDKLVDFIDSEHPCLKYDETVHQLDLGQFSKESEGNCFIPEL